MSDVLSPAQVREVYSRTGGVVPPVGLNAFRIPEDPNIYVNAESEVYRDAARNRSAFHLLRLAATLLHEQVHETDDEYAARRLQADFVRSRLDALPPAQRASADRYWRTLEARAVSLGLAERRSRRLPIATRRAGSRRWCWSVSPRPPGRRRRSSGRSSEATRAGAIRDRQARRPGVSGVRAGAVRAPKLTAQAGRQRLAVRETRRQGSAPAIVADHARMTIAIEDRSIVVLAVGFRRLLLLLFLELRLLVLVLDLFRRLTSGLVASLPIHSHRRRGEPDGERLVQLETTRFCS